MICSINPSNNRTRNAMELNVDPVSRLRRKHDVDLGRNRKSDVAGLELGVGLGLDV